MSDPIRNFDDLVEESKKLPDLNQRRIIPSSPLEDYFLKTAEKQGITDALIEGEDYDEY